jgi:hypothetical protein
MGQICFGEDPQLEREVATKVSSLSRGGIDARFAREAKVLAQGPPTQSVCPQNPNPLPEAMLAKIEITGFLRGRASASATSRHDLVDHMPLDIRQTEIPTRVAIRERFMVQPEQRQNRRV